MRIHCTKKLADYLGVKAGTSAGNLAKDGGLGDWHANIYTYHRRKCLLFVHDVSRYAVFIPCITRGDIRFLDAMFEDILINSLMKTVASTNAAEAAAALLSPMVFDTECDRSVQGTMRLLADEIDWIMSHENLAPQNIAPYSFSARISHCPCTTKNRKGYFWPDEEMLKLLG